MLVKAILQLLNTQELKIESVHQYHVSEDVLFYIGYNLSGEKGHVTSMNSKACHMGLEFIL